MPLEGVAIIGAAFQTLCAKDEPLIAGGEPDVELVPSVYCLARSFAAEGSSVTQPEELKRAIKETFDCKGPALRDVKISSRELTSAAVLKPGRLGRFQSQG